MPAASGCTIFKLRPSAWILRIISRRCLRFIECQPAGSERRAAFLCCFCSFCCFVGFTLSSPLINSIWLGPGSEIAQSPQRGQALFLIQDKPATIFTIAKTGAMLLIGQIRSRETAALAVEPGCGSDSKSRATLRRSTSLGKTLQACRETQGEFQGHTITPLGVTGAFCRHRF